MAYVDRDMMIVLKHYAGFGYLFYSLYQKEKVSLKEIAAVFLKWDPEQSSLHLAHLLKKIKEEDLEEIQKEAEEMVRRSENKDTGGSSLTKDQEASSLNLEGTERILAALTKEDPLHHRIYGKYQVLLERMEQEMSKNPKERRRGR